MTTYCYKCSECGLTATSASRNRTGSCSVGHPAAPIVRDYRAENAGATGMVQLKHERSMGGRAAYRDAFLPTAEDYASPSDPDGERGLRTWADEHQPTEDNKRPLYPDIKRRSW